MSNKVLISEEELQYLRACEFTFNIVNTVAGMCPNCRKAMLVDGLVCMNCGYDNSYTVEEWKEMKGN